MYVVQGGGNLIEWGGKKIHIVQTISLPLYDKDKLCTL